MPCVRKQTLDLVKLDRNAEMRPSFLIEGEIWRERIFVDREPPTEDTSMPSSEPKAGTSSSLSDCIAEAGEKPQWRMFAQ
jgi:hypothetical protein